MTQEEKARAYDKAIERARLSRLQLLDIGEEATEIEYIFPELKGESEDERIRKGLIKAVSRIFEGNKLFDTDVTREEALAWLEKQGEQKVSYTTIVETGNGGINALVTREITNGCDDEQKPFDYENANIQQKDFAPKVEPKFKVGDWVVYYRNDSSREVLQVYDIRDGRYYFTDNVHFSWSVKECDEKCHLWTIQDAKDGDVLFCKGDIKYSNGIKYEKICLFKNLDSAFFTLTKTSNYIEEYDTNINIDYPDNTVPATKEQREILFMAMADAGYEWDAEKKELKKIDNEIEKLREE